MHKYTRIVSSLLADGSLCRWSDGQESITPTIYFRSVSAVASFFNTDIVLMQNGSIIMSALIGDQATDITAEIYKRLGGGTRDLVSEIYMYKGILAARAGNCVCTVNPRRIQDICLDSKLHTFSRGISLTRFGKNHGFVRTNDGCLYLTEGERAYDSIYGSFGYMDLVQIAFADAHNIRDIICGQLYSLFIMENDSIYVQGRPCADDMGQQIGIQPLELCRTEHIVNVIAHNEYVFYITAEGICYASYISGRTKCIKSNESKYPVLDKHFASLLKPLAGLFVEDVFVAHRSFIIRHDGGSLCLLPKRPVLYDIGSAYDDVTAIPLPFFDDKHIVGITSVYRRIYFTTAEGLVYQSGRRTFVENRTAEKVEFFDEHPVAVKSTQPRIASGRSCLDD